MNTRTTLLVLTALWIGLVGCGERSVTATTDTPAPAVTDATPAPPEDGEVEKLVLTDDQWKQRLTPEQYEILRNKGTEPAFRNAFNAYKGHGTYICAGCDLPLFASSDKFDSGTGWPSFTRPIDPAYVLTADDASHGMLRTEVLCARCEGHLGHVFDDGPPPTGKRYCMNSAAMKFAPQTAE